MTNIITHQGIVENISGSQVFVRIIQTSACSTCSVKGHCSSADSKEKVIEVTDTSSAWKIGDEVTIIGATSMGMQAVLLAFLIPLFLLIFGLFIFKTVLHTIWGICCFGGAYSLLLYNMVEQNSVETKIFFYYKTNK